MNNEEVAKEKRLEIFQIHGDNECQTFQKGLVLNALKYEYVNLPKSPKCHLPVLVKNDYEFTTMIDTYNRIQNFTLNFTKKILSLYAYTPYQMLSSAPPGCTTAET